MRINSAADDAAGLAISEKMRRQVRGLNRAVLNAQDGISMIQTAKVLSNESQSIVQKMRTCYSGFERHSCNDRLEIQKKIKSAPHLEVNESLRIPNSTPKNCSTAASLL